MEAFRERLGEAVGERADHDRAVVVEGVGELVRERLAAVDGNGERTHRVGQPGRRGSDVVGERSVRAGVRVVGLLPEHGEPEAVEHDVVLLGVRRPEAVDTARLQRAGGGDLVEELVRVAKRSRATSPFSGSSRIAGYRPLSSQAWKKNVQST